MFRNLIQKNEDNHAGTVIQSSKYEPNREVLLAPKNQKLHQVRIQESMFLKHPQVVGPLSECFRCQPNYHRLHFDLEPRVLFK